MSSNKSQRPDFRKNNPELAKLIKDAYTLSDLSEIIDLLKQHSTLVLRRYLSGGASAVTILDQTSLISALGDNLQFMWTRDSVLQAIAEYTLLSDPELVQATQITEDQWKRGLLYNLRFYEHNQGDFINIIDGKVSGRHEEAARHPAIRFNAVSGKGVPWPWPHKQNDAHGFLNFLMFWQLNKGNVQWSDPKFAKCAEPYATLLHHLFDKTNVWTDEDFGAWEDIPAVHFSSIMCVAVGLAEQLEHMRKTQTCITYHSSGRDWVVCETAVERLLQNCINALKQLGTNESLYSFARTSDLAQLNGLLLQTVAKRQIIDDHTVDQIITRIEDELMGPYGIARYHGDVWDGRDRRLEFVAGRDEMEWCHGSPTIVCILGERYLRTQDPRYFEWTLYHFNRTLGNVTEDWVTPEAYRIDKETKNWAPDENRPLAWTQSVTAMALSTFKQCVALKAQLDAAAASAKAAQAAASAVASGNANKS